MARIRSAVNTKLPFKTQTSTKALPSSSRVILSAQLLHTRGD